MGFEQRLESIPGGQMEKSAVQKLTDLRSEVEQKKDQIWAMIGQFGQDATVEGTPEALQKMKDEYESLQQEWIKITDMIKSAERGDTVDQTEIDRISQEFKQAA